jgi:hypothetical protein
LWQALSIGSALIDVPRTSGWASYLRIRGVVAYSFATCGSSVRYIKKVRINFVLVYSVSNRATLHTGVMLPKDP